MFHDDEASSSSTASTIQMTVDDVAYDLKTIREEERRLKAEQKIQIKKPEEENQIRKENAIKAMNYLLQKSQTYATLLGDKLQNNKKKPSTKGKFPLQEKQENIMFNKDEISKIHKKSDRNTKVISPVYQQPLMIQPKNFVGNLYPYQMEGLSWLQVLYENSINGILADEMGLGKTIQIIALICSLLERNICGPFLIVAPLSTIPNWLSEFKKFAPKIPVVLFYGSGPERLYIYPKIRQIYSVDGIPTGPVVLTSFQIPIVERKFLRSFKWQYLIIDEGHRIKNFKCKLFKELKQLKSLNRLLITGTPLQNNLQELWTLLHFLLPEIFRNMNTFADIFQVEDFIESDKILKQEQDTNIISILHGVLSPFVLRRLKSEVLKNMVPKKEVLVYCPLSQLQTDLYRYVLQRNMAKLTGNVEETENIYQPGRKRRKCAKKTSYLLPDSEDEIEEDSPDILNFLPTEIPVADKKALYRRMNMNNPTMLMRKIVNHPFTVHCPLVPGTREILISEDIVSQCGKMMVLDAMLIKLKKRGHKVLLFCTFTSVLDFIEDYLIIRGYGYCRLDGCSKLDARQKDIHDFNTKCEKFVFLISTRAGCLGLNLTAADTVILFDRDWNPQIDLQAQDRCHRIGQKKPVIVYTFVSKGTIDEYILTRSTAKRRLEKIVIQKGKFGSYKNPNDLIKSATDLKELEELLNSVDHQQEIQTNGFVFTDEELERLLDRSDLYKEMEERNNFLFK